MKWFEHDTDARHDPKIKRLEKIHGLIGYAIYFKTIEIIGEHIEKDNLKEWGLVDDAHTMETLAEDVGVDIKTYEKVINTCDALGLFERFEGKLSCKSVLFRVDEYAQRFATKGQLRYLINSREKQSGQNPDNIGTLSGQNRATIPNLTIPNQELVSKDTNDEPSKEPKNFGKENVNFTLECFQHLYGFSPTDRKPRFVANTLIKQIATLQKKRGKFTGDDSVHEGIKSYFAWVSKQDWHDKIQNLDTIRRKISIFEGELNGTAQ